MQANRDHFGRRGHDALEDTDDTSDLLPLIMELSLEDIDRVRSRRKGKSRDGSPLSDEELALQLYEEEINALDTFSHDRQLARALDSHFDARDDFLFEGWDFAEQEEMERRDRELAIALAEGQLLDDEVLEHAAETTHTEIRPPAAPSTSYKPASWRRGTSRGRDSSPYQPASSASRRASRARDPAPPPSAASRAATEAEADTCVICMEVIEGDAVYAPCGHCYDVDCFLDLVRAAVVDESLFPPACCRQPFPTEEVRAHLDRKLRKQFDEKTLEFGTANRVYCHEPTCSTFLGAATHSARALMCTTCGRYTCGHCKGAAHSRNVRCTSTEDAEVLALAEQEGWKQCPRCGHLVELAFGCYHMTCRCRHEFCYLCTAPWKTCNCDQWDERRLVQAAEHRVQQQQLHWEPPPDAAGRAFFDFHERVRQETERLRFDHVCQQHLWCYVFGPNVCENCGQYTFPFWHCPCCQMHLCPRCRSNRWL
ncbi:hypothetical protein OH77DRAFT_466696 [Trametes cingulata]|nr:hypothetical protein OH77DRAFT_466696 [Trametes cingulata]